MYTNNALEKVDLYFFWGNLFALSKSPNKCINKVFHMFLRNLPKNLDKFYSTVLVLYNFE